LAFSPRKRARSETCRIKRDEVVPGRQLQGFVGYKAGMTHLILNDNYSHSLTKGMEIFVPVTVIETPPVKVEGIPVTVIETPPVKVEGIRLYKDTVYGLKALTEVWAGASGGGDGGEGGDLDRITDIINADETDGMSLSVRLIIATIPELVSGVPKKRGDLMELKMSGVVHEDIEYARKVLGKEIRVEEVFKEGDFVDVTAVTKGKGTQGPVKRWGVTIQNAKAKKSGKGRTEYNKRILKIGTDGAEITPKGGFLHYGLVRNGYILVKGSVPGPKKRLIRISHAIRPHPKLPTPEIAYISRESQQGN